MANEKKGILRFDEGMKQFICWSKEGGLTHPHDFAVDIYLDNDDIGYITKEGNVTYVASGPDLDFYPVTLTSEQRKLIDITADRFKRKCDVEVLIAACEEVMTLRQFPMIKDPPSESPLTFDRDSNGDTILLKNEYLIGVMRVQGSEFGRLFMYYSVIHTGLTEFDKRVILAKCREIVASITF